MKHWTIIAALLHAAANAITSNIGEASAEPDNKQAPEQPAGDTPAAPTARRGRPPGSTNAPKETPVAAATPAAASTDEAGWQAAKKALIQPYIDDNKGADVKAIIAKHVAAGGSGLKDVPLSAKAAFEKDLSTLDY